MIILGLDLATSSGFTYGRPDTTPFCGAVRAPACGEDLGAFGAFYWEFFNRTLDALYERLEPEETLLVNYEAPVLPRQGMTQIATTRKLQSLGVLLETACELHAARTAVYECHLQSMKKELGGSGRATKPDMVFAARRAGISLPEGPEAQDAADSFGAWLLAVRHHAREHSAYWDRRVHGGFKG